MKQDTIVDVAEQLFAEKGYEGASVRDIAARAAINIAMISYYFGSKEELFKAVIERRTTVIGEYLESLNRDPALGAMERLELYIDHYLTQRFAHRSFYKIVHRELSLDQPSETQDFLATALTRSREELRKIIRNGIRRGEFIDVDSEMTIATIIGLVNLVMNSDAYACKIFHDDGSPRSEKKMRERLSVHIRSLVRSYLLQPQQEAALTIA